MLLGLSAEVEALLDFSDEDDVNSSSETLGPDLAKLTDELRAALARPASERLRDGIRVTIAGPPNAGKSSLLNALAGRDAAITSAIPGTTRDVIQLPLAINGVPYLFSDTAGLRHSGDEIEAIGVDRAREAVAGADLILWLGAPEECPVPERSILVSSKSDLGTQSFHLGSDVAVSSYTGAGLSELMSLLSARATELLPPEGEIALNNRHRDAIRDCLAALEEAASSSDLVLSSEHLRMARLALHRITGAAGVENMLDVLFGRFCIGK
jgi:tRNA modification GTPase